MRAIAGQPREGDLVWVGNWGDEERTAELHEFLLEPVRALGLRARVHGVRYPEAGLAALRQAGVPVDLRIYARGSHAFIRGA